MLGGDAGVCGGVCIGGAALAFRVSLTAKKVSAMSLCGGVLCVMVWGSFVIYVFSLNPWDQLSCP
jgi:hypothetical protein